MSQFRDLNPDKVRALANKGRRTQQHCVTLLTLIGAIICAVVLYQLIYAVVLESLGQRAAVVRQERVPAADGYHMRYHYVVDGTQYSVLARNAIGLHTVTATQVDYVLFWPSSPEDAFPPFAGGLIPMLAPALVGLTFFVAGILGWVHYSRTARVDKAVQECKR